MLRRSVIAVLPWLAFVPFVRVPGLPVSLDDLLPLAIVSLGLLALLLGRRPPYEAATAGFILLGMLGLAAAIVNATSDAHFVRMAARGAGRPFFYAGLLVTACAALRDHDDVVRLCRWLVLAAVAQSLFGIWAYHAGYVGPFGIGVSPNPDWTSLRRVQGTFATDEGAVPVSANFLGAYLMCMALVASGMGLLERGWRRVAAELAAAVCTYALALTFTRTSVIGVVLGIAVLTALARRPAGLAALLVLGVISLAPASPLGQRMSSLRNDRLALATAAARISMDHPLVGVGDGNYENVRSSSPTYYQTPTGKATATPHNSYLLAAAHYGLAAGVILGVITVLSLGRAILGALWATESRRRTLLATLAAACVAFALQSLTNDLLFVPKNAIFFWLFVAMSVVVMRDRPVRAAPARPSSA